MIPKISNTRILKLIKKYKLDIEKIDLYLKIFEYYKNWLKTNYNQQTELENVFRIISDMELYQNNNTLFDRIKIYCKYSPCARTYEKTIARYGEIEGNKRWNNYKNRQSETNTFEYKHKKYGWTKEQFDEYNASRAVTKENLIRRHGEALGLKKWEAYCKRQAYAGITLEYFIEKYGENEGRQKYIVMLEKKASSILKFAHGISNFESTVLTEIFNYLNIPFKRHNTINRQYKLTNNKDYVVYFDAHIPNTNLFIEINGDYWHCNPKIYTNPNEIIREQPVSYYWNRDKKKIEFANLNGFYVFTIWESDWKHHKSEILKAIKEWSNKKECRNLTSNNLDL